MESKTSNQPTNHGSEQTPGIEFSRGQKEFLARRQKATRVALISPELRGRYSSPHHSDARRAEFSSLARAIHLDVTMDARVPVRAIRPATYFGVGQAAEMAEKFEELEVELVLVDTALSPIQQRNLEKSFGAKVLDRTALILEIFGDRAVTREGVLQVELAHLNYQRSRLVKSWTHLERQRGGFGFLGGPGETQIEADRRQLRDRTALLEKRIEKIRKTRMLQRKPRDAVPFPMVALVGYTNAGKSTLFNRLTGADVEAKNLLFATLDTTVRKATLPHGRDIILSDTVGFIADLPTDLVAAFRATLEEVVMADVILHVRDISSLDNAHQANEVMNVLKELGVNTQDSPIIEVWNKSDLIAPQSEPNAGPELPTPNLEACAHVSVSAATGQGMEQLLMLIENTLAAGSQYYEVFVPHALGQDIGWLYDHSEVLSRDDTGDEGSNLQVRVQPRQKSAFVQRFAGRFSKVKNHSA